MQEKKLAIFFHNTTSCSIETKQTVHHNRCDMVEKWILSVDLPTITMRFIGEIHSDSKLCTARTAKLFYKILGGKVDFLWILRVCVNSTP